MQRKSLCAISLALSLQWTTTVAFSQEPAAAAPAAGGGQPVDIQANEQEFADGQIIAKGNVRVTMRDTLVIGPAATLFRDSSGNAQKAVFTGHPHLIQGSNKIDATTLIFEMGSQQVIADGNAHSEVMQDEGPPPPPKPVPVIPGSKVAPGSAPALTGKPGKPGEVVWPTKKSDDAKAKAQAPAKASTPAQAVKDSTAEEEKPEIIPYTDNVPKSIKIAAEKIITDSDHQEYEQASGKFIATGHVRVKHGDIFVRADKLQLVYSADGKPETALFNGNVNATQNDNNTVADHMTYFLSTQRLQATGNVKSKVIQKKAEIKKGGPDDEKEKADKAKIAAAKAVTPPPDAVHTKFTEKSQYEGSTAFDAISADSGDPMVITSDLQDYGKDTGRMNAEGNVHLFYGTTTGSGPKVILYRNADGDAEKVVFIGRSLINQPGKRWIGDKITMMVSDSHVLAQGNTRAIILQNPTNNPNGAPPASKPTAPATESGGSKLADHEKGPTI